MAKNPDTILVERGPGETRYALLAGDAVIEVAFARDVDIEPGCIIAGRVKGLLGDDCFIDIGAASPGVARMKSRVTEGQAVAVEVVVPPRADKGAKLKFADISMPEDVKIPSVLRAAPEILVVWWQRYHETVTNILCAPASEHRRVRALLAHATVEMGEANLFEMRGVEEAIEAVLDRTIELESGGSIAIESTAGAVVVDVDAGAGSPEAANREAIDAVATALRLRNLGGHILIDIIPPSGKRATIRAAALPLVDRLKDRVASDPVPTDVAGVTPLGMIELARKRTGLSVAERLTGKYRASALAYDALRRAVRMAFRDKAARIAIDAPPDVAALLHGKLKPAVAEAIAQCKADIMVSERPGETVDVLAF